LIVPKITVLERRKRAIESPLLKSRSLAQSVPDFRLSKNLISAIADRAAAEMARGYGHTTCVILPSAHE
jgi:hypothetical protein